VVWRGADGHPVASSIMSVADGILITGNVVTAPSERRRGHGAAMMRTGLAWARSVGAEIAALNVAAGNVAAQALYRRLGYEVQYGYHYRVSA
jgi:ribosomal protein S18 acetylase RimI-like enzyme